MKSKFKVFQEGISYFELEEQDIEFDENSIIITDTLDLHKIMDELNKVSHNIFVYGSLYDTQKRLLQKVEDEFELWKALKLKENNITDKEYKSEKSKERFLLTNYQEEYMRFKNTIADENYKLDLLKRVVQGLENYSYKLHAMKDINLYLPQSS